MDSNSNSLNHLHFTRIFINCWFRFQMLNSCENTFNSNNNNAQQYTIN